MPLKSIDSPRPSGREYGGGGVQLAEARRRYRRRPARRTISRRGRPSSSWCRGTSERPLKRPRSSALESILGDTDRRKQILETELTPWRMICALEIESQSGAAFVGTGWFAGPRTVITAGHCVFDPVELGGWAKKITVVPGPQRRQEAVRDGLVLDLLDHRPVAGIAGCRLRLRGDSPCRSISARRSAASRLACCRTRR